MFRKKDISTDRRRPVSSRTQPESKNRKKSGSTPGMRNQRTNRQGNPEKLVIKNRSMWRMLPSFVALSAIILSGVYMLHLNASSARIRMADASDRTNVNQNESQFANQKNYQYTFSELLDSSILNRTKLTVRSSSIIENFQRAHPEVAYAEVRYGIVDSTPILFVVLREAHVIISAEDDTDSSYVVDAKGVAFARIASDEVLEGVPNIEDDISVDIEIGQQVLPIGTIHFIDDVLYQLEVAEYTVGSMALPAIANEMHVRLAGDEFVGKFDITGNPRLQSGSFIATRGQLLGENEEPNEYIDVRVSGRAYYR